MNYERLLKIFFLSENTLEGSFYNFNETLDIFADKICWSLLLIRHWLAKRSCDGLKPYLMQLETKLNFLQHVDPPTNFPAEHQNVPITFHEIPVKSALSALIQIQIHQNRLGYSYKNYLGSKSHTKFLKKSWNSPVGDPFSEKNAKEKLYDVFWNSRK